MSSSLDPKSFFYVFFIIFFVCSRSFDRGVGAKGFFGLSTKKETFFCGFSNNIPFSLINDAQFGNYTMCVTTSTPHRGVISVNTGPDMFEIFYRELWRVIPNLGTRRDLFHCIWTLFYMFLWRYSYLTFLRVD